MFESTDTTGQVTILNVEEDDELRRVSMAYNEQGDLIITERCDGVMTMAAFGTFAHTCRVAIRAIDEPAAIKAMGCSDKDALCALNLFFADDSVCLADLQDSLDAATVAYECTVWNGSEAAYRAQRVQDR